LPRRSTRAIERGNHHVRIDDQSQHDDIIYDIELYGITGNIRPTNTGGRRDSPATKTASATWISASILSMPQSRHRAKQDTGQTRIASADRERPMPGMAERAAQAASPKSATDMSRFPTPAHLASWARVCPGNNESAVKRRSSATGKANDWLRATFNEAAWAAARTKRSYYRELDQRMKARQGPKKAIGAVLKALWYMLPRHVRHEDLGAF
jgi:hypothetical protein